MLGDPALAPATITSFPPHRAFEMTTTTNPKDGPQLRPFDIKPYFTKKWHNKTRSRLLTAKRSRRMEALDLQCGQSSLRHSPGEAPHHLIHVSSPTWVQSRAINSRQGPFYLPNTLHNARITICHLGLPLHLHRCGTRARRVGLCAGGCHCSSQE